MKFIPMKGLLQKAYSTGYAVPAFCAWSAETIDIVLKTAEAKNSPVIILSGPGELGYFSPKRYCELAYMIAENYSVPAALLLDHGDTLQLVQDCIKAKYTSVMLDYSTRPYKENVDALKKVVQWAKAGHISVEGEIGAVGKVSEEGTEGALKDRMTEPEEAERYVKDTGIDTVAVMIGNKHGIYTKPPKFDFDRLQKIHERVNIPLSLHGGSTTPEADIKRAIQLGIAKVNVASEITKIMRDTFTEDWTQPKSTWFPLVYAKAVKKIPEILERWIGVVGSANQA
jgi:ketose-bisphosphate aldolase